MKFEGRPISARKRLVNASLALGLIFAVSACSGEDTPDATITPQDAEELAEVIELPAVWSTGALEKPVVDIAISGGLSPILAVAYERSGLHLFNLDAETLAEAAPYSVKKLAAGYIVNIDGAELSVFPGINSAGDLKGYVFGEGLIAPVEIDLNIDAAAAVVGLCSAPASSEADGLFRLGYWTSASDSFVHTGRLVEVNGEFAWLPDGPATELPNPVAACTLTRNGVTGSSGNIRDTAQLTRDGYDAIVTLSETGAISAISDTFGLQRLLVADGISIKMPETPTAIAALGKPLEGGYGGGLIIATGEVDGETKAVFIATDNLTGVSASDQ